MRRVTLAQANAALRKLPEYAALKTQQEMNVTAFQIAQLARTHAPVRTGTLAQAIGWKARRGSAVVGVEAVAYYWKYVEYGTRYVSKRPMFRPAKEALEPDHHARMRRALEAAADEMEASA